MARITQHQVDKIVEKKFDPCPSCFHPLKYTTFITKRRFLWGLTTCPMNSSHYTYMRGLGRQR